MTTEKLSIEQWRREAPELRSKSEKALERFEPARRQKPRHPAEAEFLRRIGTPERLIGPPQTSLGEASLGFSPRLLAATRRRICVPGCP